MNTNTPSHELAGSTNSKKIYLEWLRIIAMLLVIYNHSGLRGYNLYTVTDKISSFWLSITMHSICKVAVPVFLMISGVTLLSKEESYKALFQKRILKYIFIILLFGTLQYFRYLRTGKVAFTFNAWFTSVFTNPVLDIYWFLYAYLGFLLLLPILRKAARSMQEKDYFYLYVLHIISCTLPFIGFFTGLFLNSTIFQLTNIVVYPLLGYGIDKYGHQIPKKCYLISFIVPVILSTTGSAYYLYLHPNLIGSLPTILQQFTPLVACGLFGLVRLSKNICNTSGTAAKIVSAVGSTVFGVYLIEDIVRKQVEKLFVACKLDNFPEMFVVGILFTIVAFAISSLIIYLVRLIPFVKKII